MPKNYLSPFNEDVTVFLSSSAISFMGDKPFSLLIFVLQSWNFKYGWECERDCVTLSLCSRYSLPVQADVRGEWSQLRRQQSLSNRKQSKTTESFLFSRSILQFLFDLLRPNHIDFSVRSYTLFFIRNWAWEGAEQLLTQLVAVALVMNIFCRPNVSLIYQSPKSLI